MFQTPSQTEKLSHELISSLKFPCNCDVLVCPPYVSLERVASVISDSPIELGAQDLHWEGQGAWTGKISGDMLKDIGARYVIVGHSEQRSHFYENDESVNKKTKAALASGLVPIICIGESLEEREDGRLEEVIARQLKGAFHSIPKEGALGSILAYEPVWAIGTGKSASPEQAQEAHAFIRNFLPSLYPDQEASIKAIPILYGGSVKGANAGSLFACPDIDGALVGGASLKAQEFRAIVEAA